jgi:hypothetical protein
MNVILVGWCLFPVIGCWTTSGSEIKEDFWIIVTIEE